MKNKERIREIKNELKTMGNPFSSRGRHIKEELKRLQNIEDFYKE